MVHGNYKFCLIASGLLNVRNHCSRSNDFCTISALNLAVSTAEKDAEREYFLACTFMEIDLLSTACIFPQFSMLP